MRSSAVAVEALGYYLGTKLFTLVLFVEKRHTNASVGDQEKLRSSGVKLFFMPFRFFQRIRIAPGLTLNLSKGGVSVSAGPRGAKFTVGTSGTRATVGLPGTGLQ